MLQQMRQFSKSWVSSLFLGALALSFGVWGIADVFRGNADTNVAHVGPTEISQDFFVSEYRNLIHDESQTEGKQITPEAARAQGLGKSTLERLISRAALDNVVKDLGLVASDDDVSARIRAIQAFNGPLGTFDHSMFLNVIRNRGYTEDSFVAAMRSDMARGQLVAGGESGFMMPPGYLRALFAYTTEVRAAEYVVLPQSAVGPIAPPDDATVLAYVKAHPGRFSTPEYRAVSYVDAGPEDVASQVKVSEDQIKQQYEALRLDPTSGFNVPEKRELEQINFPSEADAKAGRAKIDAGQSFDALAQARGLKPSEIALGALVAADLDKNRVAAAFALPEGGVSQPVKSTFGWVIMHVVKITPGVSKTYDQVKDEIKRALADRVAGGKLIDIVNAYTDAASGGADIAEAGKKAGMHGGRLAAIDRTGLSPDGSKSAVADPDFLAQVFQADVGEEGDPFLTKAGHYYAIKVEGVVPPKLKPLETVRAEAVAAWTAEQSASRLKEKARQMALQAGRDGSLANVAKTLGVSVQKSAALFRPDPRRTASEPAFSPALVTNLFSVGYGGTVAGPALTGGGFIVARVTGILHPTLTPDQPGYQQGLNELSGTIASDITASLANAARAKQGVKINQKLVDQAVGGEGS